MAELEEGDPGIPRDEEETSNEREEFENKGTYLHSSSKKLKSLCLRSKHFTGRRRRLAPNLVKSVFFWPFHLC